VPISSGEPEAKPPLVNIANGLTLIRLVLVPVFIVLFVHDGATAPIWRLAATAAFLAAAITDRFDGHLARSRGLVTDFGKLADPIADKALVAAALICLSVYGLLSWWVTGIILGREVAVTVIRLMVRKHKVMAASWGGKVKTVTQMSAITGYLLPPQWIDDYVPWLALVIFVLMVLAVAVTVATGIDYAVSAWDIVRAAKSPAVTADPAPEPVDAAPADSAETPAAAVEPVTPREALPPAPVVDAAPADSAETPAVVVEPVTPREALPPAPVVDAAPADSAETPAAVVEPVTPHEALPPAPVVAAEPPEPAQEAMPWPTPAPRPILIPERVSRPLPAPAPRSVSAPAPSPAIPAEAAAEPAPAPPRIETGPASAASADVPAPAADTTLDPARAAAQAQLAELKRRIGWGAKPLPGGSGGEE
jgi:CDP-diacylglycerol--glycerol-3-phosphate 3-phosphatidyltransferase